MSGHLQGRKERAHRELRRWVSLLKKEYTPDKILVFGSWAKGNFHPTSDIDLIIIKETSHPFLERLKHIFLLLKPKVGLDALVYTPEEYDTLCRTRLFFQKEILPYARTLYERRSCSLGRSGPRRP